MAGVALSLFTSLRPPHLKTFQTMELLHPVNQSRVVASSQSIESQNPHPTIRILVIDDDITTLSIVSSSLKACGTKLDSMVQLSVVTMRSPIDALVALRERDFDLVVTDLHMPEMDGIQLQKQVDAEFNLPVVIMSSNDSESVILSSLHSGVAFYIVKPFKDDDLKNIWQYAITSKKGKSLLIIDEELKSDHSFMQKFKAIIIGSGENGCSSNSSAGQISYEEVNSKEDQEECKKRGRSNSKEDEDNHIPPKKAKLVWTNSLHNRFLQAVHYIGLEKAVPKKILECMNVPGLTRENVASHLQKYRLFLKKVAEQGLSSIKNLSEESLRFITSFDSSLVLENGQQNYYSQWLEEQQLDQEGNMSFIGSANNSIFGQNRQPSTGASSAQLSHYENARAFENSLMGFQQESLMFGNKNPFYDQHNPRFESDSTNNSRFMSLSGMNNNNINVVGQKDVGMFSSLGQEPAGFFPVRFENAKQMPPVLTSFNQENGGSGIINPSAFNNPMNNHSIFFNNANISTHQPQFHHQDDFTRELLSQPMNFTTPNNQLQGIGGAMNLNFTDNGNVMNNSHPNFSEEARGNPVVADPDNMYQIDNTWMIQNWDDGFKNDLFGSDLML